MTMAERHPGRRRLAFALVGAGMALTIVALVMAAATAQDGPRGALEIESRAATDGQVVWRARLPIDGLPLIMNDRVIVPTRDKLIALDEDGLVEWETHLGPVRRIEGQYSVVYAFPNLRGSRHVTALAASSGEVLWESEGSGFVAAGRNFMVLADEGGQWMASASSGERVADIGPGWPKVHVGPDAVAFMSERTLTIISSNGATSEVTRLPEGTRIGAVVVGAVITHQRDGPAGRIVRAFYPATSAELWMDRFAGFRSAQAQEEALLVTTRDGRQLLDPTTGALLDAAAPTERWLKAPADVDPIVMAALMSEHETADGSMRYFTNLDGTMAVEAASGEVRWARLSDRLLAVDNRFAFLRHPGRDLVLAGPTGRVMTEIARDGDHQRAEAGGRILLVADGKVSINGAGGSMTDLAQLEGRTNITALSADYAVVHQKGSRGASRRLTAFNLAVGGEIALTTEVDQFLGAWLDGTTLVLSGTSGTTEIELTSGEVTASDTWGPTKRVLAAFDSPRRRLRWTADRGYVWSGPLTLGIGVIGDSIVMVSLP